MSGSIDAMNIDLKSFNEDFYLEQCGAKLSGVLDTIKHAFDMGFLIECTTLVIPGLNDSDEELGEIAGFIAGVSKDIPWHVSAFHPDYKMMDRDVTPAATLERAWKIGKDAGLKFVYTGNILGGHDDTACPGCGKTLVVRQGMRCLECRVKDGKCYGCGEEIYGVW